tara:strand:- start:845 stop:1084 length:240 start_codon:yes stop_codon:yes gene_type:complete
MSGQSFFTGSVYQNRNLVISSGDNQPINNLVDTSSINIGELFSDFLRNNIDVSFGSLDVSGNLSINNGNILINNNLTIG